MAKELEWYEVWADDSSTPPYLLIVLKWRGGECVDVHDPLRSLDVLKGTSYMSARAWLSEDEFEQVEGRVAVEYW